jgi:hypothetical protein
MIGKKISPVLVEIEEALLDFEVADGGKPNYTKEGFRSATKIFMSVLMDKMYEKQAEELISEKDRLKMAEEAGGAIRKLVKFYTGIDTFDLYK